MGSNRSGTSRSRGLSLQSLRRAVSWHRRKLAVLAAVAAALTGINAALPPEPPTVEVVQVASQLTGGSTLTLQDLRTTSVPEELVPQGALTDLDAAVGRSVRAPLSRGQLLTELSVVTVSSSVQSGRVVAPLRLADADVAALLTIGDVVDVVAADDQAGKATVVAGRVRVVGLPPPPSTSGVGGSTGATGGALVLVEVDSTTATLLAQAAVTSTLSVVLR
jgi:Flp pilus assembly protein CpaB